MKKINAMGNVRKSNNNTTSNINNINKSNQEQNNFNIQKPRVAMQTMTRASVSASESEEDIDEIESSNDENASKNTTTCSANNSISKKQFMELANPLSLTLGNTTFKANPRLFHTGSCGWFWQKNIQVQVEGQQMKVKLLANVTVKGSKTWKYE